MDGADLHKIALPLAAPSTTVPAAAGPAKPAHAVAASVLLATQQPLGACLSALAHAAAISSLVAAVQQGLAGVGDGGAAVLRLVAAACHGLVESEQAQPAKVV